MTPDRGKLEFENLINEVLDLPAYYREILQDDILSDPDWWDWLDKVGVFRDEMKTECKWADQDLTSLGSGMVRTDA